jgi:hypothetical protein
MHSDAANIIVFTENFFIDIGGILGAELHGETEQKYPNGDIAEMAGRARGEDGV